MVHVDDNVKIVCKCRVHYFFDTCQEGGFYGVRGGSEAAFRCLPADRQTHVLEPQVGNHFKVLRVPRVSPLGFRWRFKRVADIDAAAEAFVHLEGWEPVLGWENQCGSREKQKDN